MSLPTKIKRFAKSRGYAVKELCTNRYELQKNYEIMDVKAVVEKGEETRIGTTPKVIPLVLASVLLAVTFFPAIILIYVFYAVLSGLRVKAMRKELKGEIL